MAIFDRQYMKDMRAILDKASVLKVEPKQSIEPVKLPSMSAEEIAQIKTEWTKRNAVCLEWAAMAKAERPGNVAGASDYAQGAATLWSQAFQEVCASMPVEEQPFGFLAPYIDKSAEGDGI